MDVPFLIIKVAVVLTFFSSFYFSVKNYRITKSQIWLFLLMGLGTASLLSFCRLIKEFFYLDFDKYESVIVVLELIKINLIPFVTAFLLAAAVTIGRESISRAIPMEKPEARTPQGVRQGKTYLLTEEIPQRLYDIFLDLTAHGYSGLGVVRTHPDEVRKAYNVGDVPMLWMSRLQVGEKAVYPNIKAIEQIIKEFLESEGRNVILLERLDYLISQQGFDPTLQFIQELSSLVYVTKSIALVHIDPLTIEKRERILLEKETESIVDKSSELEEELVELLRYVYEKNMVGTKPNLKQVSRDLSLSRNTVKKRINSLKLRNFLILKEKGRQKVLEITRAGENFIQ